LLRPVIMSRVAGHLAKVAARNCPIGPSWKENATVLQKVPPDQGAIKARRMASALFCQVGNKSRIE
jgi:hypothetical protein